MKKVLITSGPTRQYIDTVRFITNDSTGFMGKTLAQAFLKKNFKVKVVTGPVAIKYPVKACVKKVLTADEMYDEVKKSFSSTDVFIFAAAVCDWAVKASPRKIHSKALKISFYPAVDVAKEIGKIKENKISVGFALEDEIDIGRAFKKMREKNFDVIVLNKRSALSSNFTTGILISKKGDAVFFNKIRKENLSELILKEVLKCMKKK